MTVYEIDPLHDPRWPEFLDRALASSVFHTPGWLRALHRTYGYQPAVFTTSPPHAELTSCLLACRVRSWITGARLVSLPFSDHCQPLVENAAVLHVILSHLQRSARKECWKYIELRLLSHQHSPEQSGLAADASYRFHTVDLRGDLDSIYRRFHESCVRRKIRKAEREQLSYEAGRSEALLQKFRHLLLLTRRRHQLPPQPMSWFRNLVDSLGERLTIHVVSNADEPVASILTLTHKKSLTYKYGVSNAKFNNLGGTPLLFWEAIKQAKENGVEELDLGRSDLHDSGLSAFKEHLGGVGSELTYYRYARDRAEAPGTIAGTTALRQAFAYLPDPIFAGVGRLLYKHLG